MPLDLIDYRLRVTRYLALAQQVRFETNSLLPIGQWCRYDSPRFRTCWVQVIAHVADNPDLVDVSPLNHNQSMISTLNLTPLSHEELLGELNAASSGKDRVLQGTVIRLDLRSGPEYGWRPRCWLMNRKEDGWSSYGKGFNSMDEITQVYRLKYLAVAKDEVSQYIEVE